ncbi:MAG: phosphate signaling complex protein PhoU [Kiritimatiellae bacterium]|nr:phosphate signaling complex protein PhoU [Kiritimatiellia bacterium]
MPRQFDEGLNELKRRLLTMGAIAEEMVHGIIATLVDRDVHLLEKIETSELELDRFQKEIDDETVRLISVYTPVAKDLRLLLMTARLNAELERIGDQTFNILKVFVTLLEQGPLDPLLDLPRMAGIVEEMVHRALNAFVDGSEREAMKVIAMDDRVDNLNDEIFNELVARMHADPACVSRALGLILVARAFERIADHAVNIAEDTVYAARGQDIRHPEADEPAP